MAAEDSNKNNKAKRRRGRRSNGPASGSATTKSLDDAPQVVVHQQHGNSLLIKLTEDAPTWHQAANQIPGRNATLSTDPLPRHKQQSNRRLVEKYRSMADELYRREVQLFGKKGSGDKDMAWIQSTISKGTLKDRIAAMSVVVSSNPVHKFHALDGLLQMAGCLSDGQPNSRVAQLAAEAMEDLFLNTFLPEDRKLITLEQRPLYLYEQQEEDESSHKSKNHKKKDDEDADESSKATITKRTLSPKVLLLWRFEEMVKEKYQLFLSQYIGYTLREGTEQQKLPTLTLAANLLKSVPEGEAVLLQMICNKLGDPARKVASGAAHELRKILSEHPAMQPIVAREVQQLAHRPQLSSKALYNCITFLNQLKFTRHDIDDMTEDVVQEDDNKKGKTVLTVKKSLPASLISTYFRLFEVTVKKATQDKDASAMKGRLLSALLSGVNRAHPFLPAQDQEMEEHVDALYRVVYKAPPAACTQALLLLFHLAVGSKLESEIDDEDETAKISPMMSEQEKARQERFYETLYSRLGHAELLRSGKHLTMFFNLVYKAMKYDKTPPRVIAYAKLLLSTTIHCPPPVVAATLFLLSEVAKIHSDLAECFTSTLKGQNALRTLDYREQFPQKALKLSSEEEEASGDAMDTTKKLAPLWEVSMLLQHYHPSVSMFAKQLGGIDYPGDPLRDFALAPFLDKFAYRNPKTANKADEKAKSVAARHVAGEDDAKSALPFNDPSFLEQKNVSSQDEFFYKFFAERAKRDKLKGIERSSAKNGDGKEGGDEDDEEMVDGAMDFAENQDFDAMEQNWDTDDEEEAFVDGLAQKIIEDSMDSNELGPDDLDDEDPDMETWDDMYDDDDDNDNDDDDEAPELQNMDEPEGAENEIDGDDFMDNVDDSDSDDPSDIDGENPFAEPKGSESDQEPDDDMEGFIPDDDDLALVADEDDDSDMEERAKKQKPKPSKKKKMKDDVPAFASSEDFEERINDEFFGIPNGKPAEEEVVKDEKNEEPKKKKGRKRKKKS